MEQGIAVPLLEKFLVLFDSLGMVAPERVYVCQAPAGIAVAGRIVDGLLVLDHRLVDEALALINNAEVVVGIASADSEPDEFLVGGNGIIVKAGCCLGVGELYEGGGPVGFFPEGGLELFGGLCVFLGLHQFVASPEALVGEDAALLSRQKRFIVGSLMIPCFLIGLGKQKVDLFVAGIGDLGLLQFRYCPIDLSSRHIE
jgi:hypothetical protein